MSDNNEHSANIDKLVTFLERWDKIAGLIATIVAAVAFAADNVWLSYAFVVIGWIFVSRWLWRVSTLKTKSSKAGLSLLAETRLPERYIYAKIQRLLAIIGLIIIFPIVPFWLWVNIPNSFQAYFRSEITPTPQALFFEGSLNDILLAKKVEASVTRILPTSICGSPEAGPIVYNCITKKPLGYLFTSVAASELTVSYLLNPEGERVGFINRLFIYDLSGSPVAIVGDWGTLPTSSYQTYHSNLAGYFDDEIVNTLMKLPITTLPLIERQGFRIDPLPNATIFSYDVPRGLKIAFIIEGHFTWKEIPTLEP